MAWQRLTVNLEPEIAEAAKARAKSKRQSFASYVASLIDQDLALREAAARHTDEHHALAAESAGASAHSISAVEQAVPVYPTKKQPRKKRGA